MDFLHNFGPRIAATIVGGLVLRLLWALMRLWLGKDPAVWIARKVRRKHPRRFAEAVRWAAIAGGAVIILAAVWGGEKVAAAFGPHEGDTESSDIYLTHLIVHERDPRKDVPFYISVAFRTDSATDLTYLCTEGKLSTDHTIIPDTMLDYNFRSLAAHMDMAALNGRCTGTLSRGNGEYSDVFPKTYFSDAAIARVKGGQQYIYVNMLWRYQRGNSPRIYTKEFCEYTIASLENWIECKRHNGTFTHVPT